MIRIAHRGNTEGSNPNLENTPKYLEQALAKGFDIEVDVRLSKQEKHPDTELYYLGHNEEGNPTTLSFLQQSSVWCHAKDYYTFRSLLDKGVHCFFLEDDLVALTSNRYLWHGPTKNSSVFDNNLERTICVMPEYWIGEPNLENFMGVCSDDFRNI